MHAWSPFALAIFAIFACAAVSCGAEDMDPQPGGIDEAAILARVSAYQTSGFIKINREPRTSQHMGQNVNFFAAGNIADQFRAIDPDDSTATATPFPSGTVIIKEQLDGSGDV